MLVFMHARMTAFYFGKTMQMPINVQNGKPRDGNLKEITQMGNVSTRLVKRFYATSQ
jgi:hypothetical protein